MGGYFFGTCSQGYVIYASRDLGFDMRTTYLWESRKVVTKVLTLSTCQLIIWTGYVANTTET